MRTARRVTAEDGLTARAGRLRKNAGGTDNIKTSLMPTQTKTSPLRFEPRPDDVVALFGERYQVQPHPAAGYMPYASEGRRAIVYQLRDAAGEEYALKVFRKKFRDQSLVATAGLLGRYESLEGMKAARRRVVLPTEPVARQCRDLEYAMLMQWIRGKTWFDILVEAKLTGAHLSPASAVHLCARFLNVMRGLEGAGVAHSDISPGNLMVDAERVDVQVLDLEDIYAPGVEPPEQRNTGSAGYRHRSADEGATTWCAEGDRYAAAVIAAEMLVLTEPGLARRATDEGYFVGHCMSGEGAERYDAAKGWLRQVAPDFADLFERTWLSESLAQCDRIADLHAAILPVALRTQRASQAMVKPAVQWSRLNIEKPARGKRRPPGAEKPSPVRWERPKPPERRRGGEGLRPLTKVALGAGALLTLLFLLKLLALL
jgi:hypothetical protein